MELQAGLEVTQAMCLEVNLQAGPTVTPEASLETALQRHLMEGTQVRMAGQQRRRVGQGQG